MHVYDPMSSLGHTVWRFLLRRAAGYAAHDLSDEIGANSCPCAFHWLWYLLGQPRFSKWLHRELVLRLLREISPQESFFGLLARHDAVATSSPRAECAGRDEVPSCGPDPAIAASEGSCVLCRLEKSVRANPRCIFIKTAVFAHPNDATGTKRCFGRAGFTRE